MASVNDLAGFKEALGADVVIPLAEPGRALSVTDALSLRSWYDARMDALRGQEDVQHHSPLG